MEYNYNGKLVIIYLVLWLLLVFINKSVYFQRNTHKAKYHILYLLTCLFCTFAFSEADTYHYHTIYDNMLFFNERVHVEPFYYWLIQTLPHNYYIWRFAVWGTALVLMIECCKRYNLDPSTVSFVFPIILLQQFAITRGALGITLFLYSLSFILKPSNNKLFSYLLAIIGCTTAFYLHKSLPLFVFLFLLSFFPLNKQTLILLIILFPLLRRFVSPVVFDVLGSNIFSEGTIGFATSYLESEQSKANFNGIIRLTIDYIPRFLLFYALIKEFVFKNICMTKPMRILFQYSFVLFYIALLFLGQNTSSFVTNRTLHMMCFPLLIVVSYYLHTTRRTKLILFTMLMFIVSDLFSFFYMIYSCW